MITRLYFKKDKEVVVIVFDSVTDDGYTRSGKEYLNSYIEGVKEFSDEIHNYLAEGYTMFDATVKEKK